VADFPLNVTLVVCFRPVPVMVTEVPTGPLGGANEMIVGVTLRSGGWSVWSCLS
jgi:hypothetical protein